MRSMLFQSLIQKCNWLFITAIRDAFEVAWSKILSSQGSDSTRKALKEMFPGREHIENRNLSLLHRTVLTLNPLNLDALLASIPRSMIDKRDSDGRTSLWWAAQRGDHEAISTLLDHGADVNTKSFAGFTVFSAAIQGRHQACLRLMLARGCDLDQRCEGWLPLHYCSNHGIDLDIIEKILDRGTKINSTTLHENYTALMIATEEHQDLVCSYLISKGAAVNLINIDGESALHIAIRGNNHKTLQLVLRYHTDYSISTRVGETLLHYAAQFADFDSLKILQSMSVVGIQVNDKVTTLAPRQTMRNLKGLTAFQIAERRVDTSLEWLAMFQNLIHRIESKAQEVSAAVKRGDAATGEEEEFQDPLKVELNSVEYQ